MDDSEKKYVLFAGVNGVGKSTLYYLHPELADAARINMDEIAASIGDWKDISVVLEAGRRAIRLRDKYFAEGRSFNQETTLCGHDIINSIKKAIGLGYRVEMHYVGVSSPEICKKRIRKRVAEGGHGVSDDVVDRRYHKSFENLRVVLSLCEKIFFYDNDSEMRLFCIYQDGRFYYHEDTAPGWFKKEVLTHD